jgi:hypothetical protein
MELWGCSAVFGKQFYPMLLDFGTAISGMSLIRYRARHSAMLWVCVHLRRLSSRVWCEGGLDARSIILYPNVGRINIDCFYHTAQVLEIN